MGIEEDLLKAFKYTSFTDKVDPLKMMRKMLENFELVMLKRMQKQIGARINMLTHESKYESEFDPFLILGVDVGANKEQVTKAYREKARKAHPDAGGTNEEMAKINAAYEAIKIFKGWH